VSKAHDNPHARSGNETILETRRVSPADARVVESVVVLSPRAVKRLQIHAEVPALAARRSA
jgi:hypothetical protein